MPHIGVQPIPQATWRRPFGKTQNATDTIAVPYGYTVGYLRVEIEGRALNPDEYTADDGMTVKFPQSLPADTNWAFEIITPFQAGDHYTKGESDARFAALDAIQWLSKPIAEPFPLWDHWGTISGPPIDDLRFRYIKLTAGEAGSGQYNEGVLTDESVTGSTPTITATAKINLTSSPLNGGTVHLLNTSRLFLRPGESSVMQASQFESHTHSISSLRSANSSQEVGTGGASRYVGNTTIGATNAQGGDETRPRNVGATYYMRIL